jgi:hypothetical protein
MLHERTLYYLLWELGTKKSEENDISLRVLPSFVSLFRRVEQGVFFLILAFSKNETPKLVTK